MKRQVKQFGQFINEYYFYDEDHENKDPKYGLGHGWEMGFERDVENAVSQTLDMLERKYPEATHKELMDAITRELSKKDNTPSRPRENSKDERKGFATVKPNPNYTEIGKGEWKRVRKPDLT